MRRCRRQKHASTTPSARPRATLRDLARLVGLALLVAAVVTELRKPREQRTWEGRIGGRIPYDLRPPSLARVKARCWNPSDRRIIVPTVVGVGWTVNFGRLLMPWVAELPEAQVYR